MKILPIGYPSGTHGIALVLLRFSTAGTLAVHSLSCDSASAGIAFVAAVLIAVGFLTRPAAWVFVGLGLLAIIRNDALLAHATTEIDGVAIALLGPGAWSFDALFKTRSVYLRSDRKQNGR